MNFVNVSGDTAVIRVPERFNLVNTSLVKTELEDAYKKGAIKVTADFRDTLFIDSSAIRDLVMVYNRVKPENFQAINVKGDVYKALYAAKLDEVWNLPEPTE